MSKITVTVKDACHMSGISRTTLYSLISDNRIDTVCVGRRRLVRVDSLMKLLEAA